MPVTSRTHGCILIVDDQPANIRTVGTLLHAEGYDVMTATSAEQALQRLRARRPDLLLLDLMMPGTSGLDLCRVLMAKPSLAEVPVIFLSAADEVALVTAGLEAGAVDYVTKPFRRAELLSRIKTHIALKSVRDELQRVAQEKDELLGLVAHDLKNGLAAIRLHAEFLAHQGATLAPAARECADTLAREAARLADCIGGMLANQMAGPPPLRFSAVDLATVTQEALEAHRAVADAKNQRVHFDPGNPGSGMVWADPVAVRQILDNLISNALKFSPFGSPVRVSLAASGPDVIGPGVRIADTGPGFTEEDRDRLYCRYAKLSAQPSGGESSTGLGLSITKRLVDRLGGTIDLESEPGFGAEFLVRLPEAPTSFLANDHG